MNISKMPGINITLNPKGYYQPNLLEKAVSFAEQIPDKFFKCIDFKQGGLTRNTNLAIAIGIVLGSRYLSARDDTERREVLTRDSIGLLAIFEGVPVLKGIIGKIIPKITGFTIKEGNGFINYDQIRDWYSIKNKGQNAFVSICENLNQKGGNLLKIFKNGDKSFQASVAHLFGKNNLNEIMAKSNDEFINILKSIDKKKYGVDIETIEKFLSKSNNSILKKAQSLKALPELACLGTIIALIGWILPWYNIHSTRKRLLNAQNHPEQNNKIENTNSELIKKVFEKNKIV
jgi:hypothetical protein